MAQLTIDFVTGKELHSNNNLDRIENSKPINDKPPVGTRGLTGVKTSSLAYPKQEDGQTDSHILPDTPNLYKQTGVSMSKIPYFFDTPVPKYFRETGWLKSEHMWKYITWAFSKCQNVPHKIVIEGKEIILEPYEFISGRLSSSKECFLTENIFRNQQKLLLNAGFLKKSTNSKTNHYSCYIWVVERFYKIENQQNNQPLTNHQPTINHKSEDKKIRYKEDHPSIPSFEKEGRDGKIDDSFYKEEKKIHVYKNIYLTEDEMNRAIQVRGSLEMVQSVVQQVNDWPGRKYPIRNWVETITNWKFKNVIADRMQKNEEFAKRLVNHYEGSLGWEITIHRDTIKDVRGVLFVSLSSVGNAAPVFILFTDNNFEEKIKETISSKKIQPRKK